MKQPLVKKFTSFYSQQDPIIFWSNFLSLLFVLIILTLFAFNLNSLPSKLPLFYSLPWGDNQLVNLSQFIILPATAILVLLANLTISWHLHTSQVVAKRMLSASTALVSFLVLVTALRIIFIFI